MTGYPGNGGNRKKPWTAVAIGAGIVCAVFIIVVVFTGVGSGIFGHGSSPAAAQPGTNPGAGGGTGQAHASGTNVSAADFTLPTPVPVPGTGVFVRVSYFGGYNGVYSANGTSHDVKSSGCRLYEITDPAGTVTAAFTKAENSAKQNITVEIWKDGRLLASNLTYAPYGKVSVSGAV